MTEGFTLPEDACPSFASLYAGLQALEADYEHIHIEKNILFPKAVIVERMAMAK